ncbi:MULTISPECIES: hypothetical protein [Rhodococcus]|uniref:Uncharacterized protein n=1 Tax=Rhodococcus chondri TaxID=3065941 RepID=A0ABU7JVD7_9NOCA|nr:MULTISPECIES: hypothetical protein [Rhodococcus]MEE2033994.1 hypothetical protein [Rhodococcus sp. CC-R104]QQM55675.1 hypothetical protein JGU70_23415 [Rhodococcus pyridinivorans]
MATSSNAAARRSLRPHTAPNVRENLRRERERVLARQAELESLAAPIHDAAAKLAKLDAVLDSRAATPQRKIEQLEKARDRRIQKIQEEYAAKIETVKAEAESAGTHLTPEEQQQESALLRDYALAIVEFNKNASPLELAPVLGVSTREAKKIIAQAKDDLAAPGTAASPATATATPVPASAADDTQPVTAAS